MRLQSADISEHLVDRREHAHTLAMYMENIRRTVVPKIQGCIQTEQWLQ